MIRDVRTLGVGPDETPGFDRGSGGFIFGPAKRPFVS
jgi:hypothetical protein